MIAFIWIGFFLTCSVYLLLVFFDAFFFVLETKQKCLGVTYLSRHLFSPGGPPLQSRHHPEHRQSCWHRSRHPRAVLRPGEDEPPQCSLPGSQQEHGAEGLPWHVRGYVRLPIRLERK